ncbi:recombinase family protein [Clostridium tyrobutyricum]|uniref:recombinase family protein n=1 Tax=Clostridium tyrobutyricum TaxID=1519 RepID=UPI001C3886A9|nr:recombinase family protein [Clostridium tyrobutyricum]MBV4420183.1 recombinase family protein [Clostridium tyrobutyricum]
MDVQGLRKWKKAEKVKSRREKEKRKIREAFSNTSTVEVIPAKTEEMKEKMRRTRVAAYCRVSTYEDAQAGSFELQVQYFKETIEKNPNYELVKIYADEGVSGTSMKKRVKFQEMIQDCRLGKIDLILTKSVSRFARNTRDCLEIIRELKALNPPVGVYFEAENLNTIESKNEFTLGVMSLVAQGESEQKSASIIWSVIERFKRGIPIISTHNLLGYDKDRYGKMVIDEEEAEVIRYIYGCYKDGQSVREIAENLTEQHIPTVNGGTVWSSSTIRNILKNEKYCGDVLMQKTFTVDCFSHKVVKNKGQKPQYRLRDHHPPIIPREEWNNIQKLLLKPRHKSKIKGKRLVKKIIVTKIKSGKLKGFVVINPKWNDKEIDQFFKFMNKNI